MTTLTKTTRRFVDYVLARKTIQRAIESSFVSLSTLPDYHREISIPPSIRNRKVWLFGRDAPLGQVDFLTARRIVARHYWFDYNIRENKRPARLRSIIDLIPIIVASAILIPVISYAFGMKRKNAR